MPPDLIPPPHREDSRWRSVALWSIPVVVLGAIIGIIWGTGGFGTDAKPYLGVQVEPGQMVSTRFWEIAVHGAEVLPDERGVELHLTAVNSQRETTADLTEGVVAILLPDGTPMSLSYCFSERAYRFLPLIPAEATCEFAYDHNRVPPGSMPGTGPFDARVVVIDQRMSDDLLTDPYLQTGEPVGWLPLRVSAAAEEGE